MFVLLARSVSSGRSSVMHRARPLPVPNPVSKPAGPVILSEAGVPGCRRTKFLADFGELSRVALEMTKCRSPTVLRLVLFGLLLVLMSAGGCGGKSRLSVSPVRGRVMHGGQGVPNAIVVFFPADDADEKAKKMRPYAYADGQGNFELKTYTEGDGAPPGKYRVSIMTVSARGSKGTKDRRAGEAEVSSGSAVGVPAEIAKKYGNVDTAGIQVTVEDGENNLEPFVLM